MAKQYYILFGDDGHGLETAGKRTPYIKALGRIIRENEFNSAVVAFMKKLFENTEVIFIETAPTDVDTSLGARVNLANRIYKEYCAKYGKENVHAIFVSVHYNAMDGKFDGEGKDPEGLSIHIDPGATDSRKLAEHVLKYLVQGTVQKNRGIVQQNLYVTRETLMTAILTENGFMDNEKEAVRMIDKNFQLEVANEHYKGIMEFFGIKAKPAPAPAPKPAPKPAPLQKLYKDVKTDSVIDFLKANNVNSSFSNRTSLATKYGIKGYKGTVSQNSQLLDALRKATKPAPKPAPAPKGTYFRVVTGSFGSKDNAVDRAKAIKGKGFDSFIDAENVGGKTTYRVITGSFSDRANANAQLAKLKKSGFDSFLVAYRK